MGEAVGRLGEKAPVGLQIFDGLAPVWLQMADSIGPVALTPVVEDAKKAVLRSEDGKGIISQKLAAANLGQSLHGQQRDSQGCFAGRTEEGLEAARDLRPERHQQADLTACDGERDRFHSSSGIEKHRVESTVCVTIKLKIILRHWLFAYVAFTSKKASKNSIALIATISDSATIDIAPAELVVT